MESAVTFADVSDLKYLIPYAFSLFIPRLGSDPHKCEQKNVKWVTFSRQNECSKNERKCAHSGKIKHTVGVTEAEGFQSRDFLTTR